MNYNYSPSEPWPIPAADVEEIATIIYTSGRRVDLSPVGSFAASSASPSLRHFSYSPSRRTRDRGASLTSNISSGSSTRGARDVFSSLNINHSGIAGATTGATTNEVQAQPSFNSFDGSQVSYESPTKVTAKVTDFEVTDHVLSHDHMVTDLTGAEFENVFQIDDLLDFSQLGDVSDHQAGPGCEANTETSLTNVGATTLQTIQPQPDALFTNLVSHTPSTAITTTTACRRDVALQPISRPKKANGEPKSKLGRKTGSHLPNKEKTAYQRLIGNCDYCKNGKRSCDPGTPCKHCLRHNIPCVRTGIQSLVNTILSAEMRCFPFARNEANFFPSGFRTFTGSVVIPFGFGFGTALHAQVQAVKPHQISDLKHQHVRYLSPISLFAKPALSHDVLLPVQFQHPENLPSLIEGHLDDLVTNHLSEFHFYQSRFQIFHSIVKLYQHYSVSEAEYAGLLHTSLKLLILVHAGDIFLDPQDTLIQRIVYQLVPMYDGTQIVVPCLLRAQLGRYLPGLARSLLKSILDRLIQICGNKRCEQHPLVLAVFALLFMSLESIMYHGARFSFHHCLGDEHASIEESCEVSLTNGEKAATELLKFYKDGFEVCHRTMARVMQNGYLARTVPDQFLAEVCQAVQSANGYLEERGKIHAGSLEDVSQLFDRLLSKLFLMP